MKTTVTASVLALAGISFLAQPALFGRELRVLLDEAPPVAVASTIASVKAAPEKTVLTSVPPAPIRTVVLPVKTVTVIKPVVRPILGPILISPTPVAPIQGQTDPIQGPTDPIQSNG